MSFYLNINWTTLKNKINAKVTLLLKHADQVTAKSLANSMETGNKTIIDNTI